MEFIDLKAQYSLLEKKIDTRIKAVLKHGQYILGPEVQELEQKLASFVGVKHCITCANGTDALQLSLMALGIGAGDAVFCPTFTFFATAEAIAFVGATPIFVDSDPKTYNMCPKDLEMRINEAKKERDLNLKAIMPVDLFGLPANYPEITILAERHHLFIIEDAAQGFGGEINGKKAGSFGDIATTSFFPAKPLGCYGDGGAVFTDNDEYAEMISSLRVHGKGENKYDNVRIGMNSRLDTIQAAILIEKLNVFPEELENRNTIANEYSKNLSEKYHTPKTPTGFKSSWAQYTLRSLDRKNLISHLKKKSIPSMVYYEICMHRQQAFKIDTYSSIPFKNAESLTKEVLSIPISSSLKREQVNKIYEELNR